MSLISKEMWKALQIAYFAYQEYERIEETTPSGKQLYQCNVCGVKDPAPCKYPYHDCVPDFARMIARLPFLT